MVVRDDDPSGAQRPARVLVIDDVADWRDLARITIEADAGWIVVGEASDGETGVEIAVAVRPDVVLLDIDMPGRGGASTMSALADAVPDAVVVVWTATPGGPDASAARERGAAAVIDKGAGLTALMATLGTIALARRSTDLGGC